MGVFDCSKTIMHETHNRMSPAETHGESARLVEFYPVNPVYPCWKDGIANGTYRVDIHHSNKAGLAFRYLDGREDYVAPGQPIESRRGRPEQSEIPTFYQIPYRSLVPKGAGNVLVAGRLIDADRGAYGGIRVMVNCNQTGEAAGTAAWLALDGGTFVADIDTAKLRQILSASGAILI